MFPKHRRVAAVSIGLLLTSTGVLTSTVALAAGPVAKLSRASISFGPVAGRNQSPQHQVTLTNAGTSALAVQSVAVGGSDPGEFLLVSDGCSGRTLDVNAACSVSVVF